MGGPPIVMASIRVTWSTFYLTVQTTLCGVLLLLRGRDRAFDRATRVALRSAGVRGFRTTNRIQRLAASGRAVESSDAQAVRSYVEWSARAWNSSRHRLRVRLVATFFIWPVAARVVIAVLRGDWGAVVEGLCWGLAFAAFALFVVRWNRKLRHTAEVNG